MNSLPSLSPSFDCFYLCALCSLSFSFDVDSTYYVHSTIHTPNSFNDMFPSASEYTWFTFLPITTANEFSAESTVNNTLTSPFPLQLATLPPSTSYPTILDGGEGHVNEPLISTFPMQPSMLPATSSFRIQPQPSTQPPTTSYCTVFHVGEGRLNDPLISMFSLQPSTLPATTSFPTQPKTMACIQLPLLSSFPVVSFFSSLSTIPPPHDGLNSTTSFISFDSSQPPPAPRVSTHMHHPLSSLTPLAQQCYREPNEVLNFGHMDIVCSLCLALHWLDEHNNNSTSSPTFGQCCHLGKALLHPLPDPPVPFCDLFTGDSPQSNDFHLHIRQYNCALAFTSFWANEQLINMHGGGPWVF
jgi:hypothetical protein